MVKQSNANSKNLFKGRFAKTGLLLSALLVFTAGCQEGEITQVPTDGDGEATEVMPESPGAEEGETMAMVADRYSDISQDFWAYPYIEAMVRRDLLTGFPDGEFRPEEPITRTELAVLLNEAFNLEAPQDGPQFEDVASDYWASEEIASAVQAGFLEGVSENNFNPEQEVSRSEMFIALAQGLDLQVEGSPEEVLQTYEDVGQIPEQARDEIAAATQANLVVNYPEPQSLNPNESVTRAEASTIIYQALVNQGDAEAIESEYVVTQP